MVDDNKKEFVPGEDFSAVNISAKAHPYINYKKEYQTQNPKSDYIKNYLNMPFAQALGNDENNYPERLDQEYDAKVNRYAAQQVFKNNPKQKNESRGEYLDRLTKYTDEKGVMRTSAPLENILHQYRNDSKDTKENLWHKSIEGIKNFAINAVDDRAHQLMIRHIANDKNLSRKEKEEALLKYANPSALSAMASDAADILSPIMIPYNATTGAAYTTAEGEEGYTPLSGLAGDMPANEAPIEYQVMADPLNLLFPVAEGLEVGSKAARALGTEEGLLSNAYKYNPWAFKPDSEAYYRMIGNEGIEDAIQSGVIRANQNNLVPYNKMKEPLYKDPYFSKGKPWDKSYTGPYMIEAKDIPMQPRPAYPETAYVPEINIMSSDPNLTYYKQDWLHGYKPINVESKAASETEKTISEIVTAARNGDVGAQQKLTNYGLDWDEKPTKYRQVGEEEIDKLFNGETVLPTRNGSYLDVSDHPFYWGKENDNFKYHVTFKDEPHFDTQLTGDARTIQKNKEKGEYGIRDGYSLNDVAKVEKMNPETGEWETIYNGVDVPDNLDTQIEKLQNKIDLMKQQEANAEKANAELIKEYKAKRITADEYRERYITPDIEGRGDLEKQIRQLKVKKDIVGTPQENILTNTDQLGENISTGGMNTKGVFDLGNGFVARKSAHGYDDASRLINYTDKLESPRIMKTRQVTELKGDVYQVQDKATGIPYTELTKEQIANIPEEQITNFWKDIEELKRNGLNIDLSGQKANVFYDPNKGFQFIDLGIGKMEDSKEISKLVGIPQVKLPKSNSILNEYRNIEQLRLGALEDRNDLRDWYSSMFKNDNNDFDKVRNESKQLLKKYRSEFEEKFYKNPKDVDVLMYAGFKESKKLPKTKLLHSNDNYANALGLTNDIDPHHKFLGDIYQSEYSKYFNKPENKFHEFLNNEFQKVIKLNKLNKISQVSRGSSFNRDVLVLRNGEWKNIHYDKLQEGDVIYPQHNWSTSTNVKNNPYGSDRALVNLYPGQSVYRPNMYERSVYPSEEEVVLPSTLQYKVAHVNRTSDPDAPRFILDVYNTHKNGGYLDKGGVPPLYVTSPNDPRYQSYKDSAYLYNNSIQSAINLQKMMQSNPGGVIRLSSTNQAANDAYKQGQQVLKYNKGRNYRGNNIRPANFASYSILNNDAYNKALPIYNDSYIDPNPQDQGAVMTGLIPMYPRPKRQVIVTPPVQNTPGRQVARQTTRLLNPLPTATINTLKQRIDAPLPYVKTMQPIVVSAGDPRLKSYQDSLTLHNSTQPYINAVHEYVQNPTNIDLRNKVQDLWNINHGYQKNNENDRLVYTPINNTPSGTIPSLPNKYAASGHYFIHKKPVQKVFVQGSIEAEQLMHQKELANAGYNITVDGVWGPKSQNAWEDYAKRNTKSTITPSTYPEQKVDQTTQKGEFEQVVPVQTPPVVVKQTPPPAPPKPTFPAGATAVPDGSLVGSWSTETKKQKGLRTTKEKYKNQDGVLKTRQTIYDSTGNVLETKEDLPGNYRYGGRITKNKYSLKNK